MDKNKTPFNQQLQKGKTPKKPPRKNLTKQTDNVEVFCRIRPMENSQDAVCIRKQNSSTVVMTPVEITQTLRNGPTYKESQYSFQHVFDEQTSQRGLFEHVGIPLVDDLLHGKNSILFAYGVTSSGKTHTMNGSAQDRGVLPRCLDCIFNSISGVQAKKYVFKPDKMNGFDVQSEADALLERQTKEINPKLTGSKSSQTKERQESTSGTLDGPTTPVEQPARIEDIDMDCCYSVFVSFIEIYNNYVYDLLEELPLDPVSGYKAPSSKNIREDSEHNMYISGVVEVEILSLEDAFDVLQKGQKRRKVAYTALNSESSRSHSVFSIRLVQGPLDPDGEQVLLDKKKLCVSQLSLVDLAGSERTVRTGSAGDRLKEAGNINQSLMVLRSCIEALRENQKSSANKMVPYRDSRLTMLFKTYFEGKGKVRMIVCVNPKVSDYDETVNVMKFAELTQEVQIARPQAAKQETGLAPGRRLANQQFKEAMAKAREDGDDMVFIKPLIYTLGPPFPPLQLLGADDDRMLGALSKFLKERENCRSTLLLDLGNKEDNFRSKLLEMDREMSELRQACSQLQSTVQSKESELQDLNRRNVLQERAMESLNLKIMLYEQERQELEREVGEKSWKVLQEKLEKDRLRQDYNAKLALNEQQYNLNMEQAKRKLKEESAAKLRSKQQKLDLLRNIINADSDSGSSSQETPRTRLGSTSLARSRAFQSQMDLCDVDATASASALRPASRLMPPPSGAFRKNRPKSPPPVKPKPMVTGKNRRRSRSTDSVWVEHKPEGNVETGTLLQPRMKTLKSVIKLTEKDIRNRDANKYVLTHHDLDSDGEMATKFVKGDILPTSSGGSAVVFTDVEVLRQKSPGDRKRRSSSVIDEENDGSWTDVETRCHVGIEGHSKKPKYSGV